MKYVVFIISILALPPTFRIFLDYVVYLLDNFERYAVFIIAIAVAAIIYYIFLKSQTRFNTFEHEFTHAFMAKLFFRRITNFIVTSRSGGHVQYSGGFGGEFGNLIITLAPYFLPTFTFILIFFFPFIPMRYSDYYLFILGLTLGYHLFSTIDETIRNLSARPFIKAGTTNTWTVSDLTKVGRFIAIVIVIELTLLVHAFIFNIIIYKYSQVFSMFGYIADGLINNIIFIMKAIKGLGIFIANSLNII